MDSCKYLGLMRYMSHNKNKESTITYLHCLWPHMKIYLYVYCLESPILHYPCNTQMKRKMSTA